MAEATTARIPHRVVDATLAAATGRGGRVPRERMAGAGAGRSACIEGTEGDVVGSLRSDPAAAPG